MSASRRTWLRGLAAAAAAALASACDRIAGDPTVRAGLRGAERLNHGVHRALFDRRTHAREYPDSAISEIFPANGSIDPSDPGYRALAAGGFSGYRLVVDGLVERPLDLDLAALRALPSRSQVTRMDCVEGWSAIARWTGARLAPVLEQAGLRPEARFLVFHCFDTLDPEAGADGRYYESIDLVDAFHPQTLLAYEMNGAPLSIAHGAPLRLRVERQLGYKHAKYIRRIEAVSDFAHISGGKGGFWEDRGYEWYAGI
jgi:DMSO/TMAO reductase YedYZ molybdopterin-dependent catalytic subunit